MLPFILKSNSKNATRVFKLNLIIPFTCIHVNTSNITTNLAICSTWSWENGFAKLYTKERLPRWYLYTEKYSLFQSLDYLLQTLLWMLPFQVACQTKTHLSQRRTNWMVKPQKKVSIDGKYPKNNGLVFHKKKALL